MRAAYPQTELAFAYDRLGSLTRRELRLLNAPPGPAALQEHHYDLQHAWGRVGRAANAPGAHAMQAAAGAASLTYDANGNLERSGDAALSWDAKNRLVGVETTQARIDYRYDYAGRRVMRVARPAAAGAQPDVTLYPDRTYEAVGTELFRYVFDGETRVARIDSQGVMLFYHPDHLGSAALLTDVQGQAVEENAFYPFGELRNRTGTSTAPHYRFVQAEHDPLADLHNFEARQLIANTSRFAAVDPVSSDIPREGLLNPQLLNGYAYAANNPLKFRDSSGKWIETGFDLVSLGFSIHAVREDPSLLNIGAVIVDAVAVALPLVPAGAGLLMKGGRVAHAGLEAAPKVFTKLADDLPVMVFDFKKMPDIADNIWHAQQAGHPSVLSHGGVSTSNRYAAQKGSMNLKGLQRDEYPFAKSLEGGSSAWIGHVPAKQNQQQGNLMQQFFKQNEIRFGDQYRVKIINHPNDL